MRNRHSANLESQTDGSIDSSSLTPPAGSAQESTGGSLMEEQTINATSNQPTTKTKKKSNVGINVMIALFALVLLAGIGLLVYPTFANWWNTMHASRAVAGYVETVKDMSADKKKELLAQAHAYNEQLNTLPDRWHLTDEQMDQYNKTLDVTGTGIMGYITIPKLEVRLPIYHGTEDTVLQIAGGHLAGSSLPVGGKDTHTAISGHTGLPSAKLFTGLDSLKEGDTFAFHVLDDTYTYQIDQIRTVLPNEMRDLDFDPNQDYATLITCTPYGVNSHRLLVRGHRIPTPANADETPYDKADNQRTLIIAGIALAIVMFILWIIWLIVHRGRKRGRDAVSGTPAKHAGR